MKSFVVERRSYTSPGRAVNLDEGNYDEIIVTGCTFTGTAGIFIQAKPGCKIRAINNTATNILRAPGMEYAQFLQVSGLDAKGNPQGVVVDCQVCGNKITNTAGNCDVEDVINLIGIRGTPKVPIRVDHNTISGAFPKDLSAKSLASYSGGGIMIDRGTGYAWVTNNTVTDTTNYGIGIAGGCYNAARGNTVMSASAHNVGMYCANMYHPDPFVGNSVKHNTVNWITPKGRNDYWIP